MRHIGHLQKRIAGDRDLANRYLGLARVLLGRMNQSLSGANGARTWRLLDGAEIRTVQSGAISIVEIDVTKVIGGGCDPIPQVRLTGFIMTPRQSRLVIRPLAMLSPIDNAFLQDKEKKYQFWSLNKETKPAAIPRKDAKFYQWRPIDTCNRIVKWYNAHLESGNVDWRGPRGIMLSWMGVPGRYFDDYFYIVSVNIDTAGQVSNRWLGTVVSNRDVFTSPGTFRNLWNTSSFQNRIWYAGRSVRKRVGGILYAPHVRIAGAAILSDPHSDKRYLLFITSDVGRFYSVTQEFVYAAEISTLALDRLVVEEPVLIGALPVSFAVGDSESDSSSAWRRGAGYNSSPWFFNESGTQAVANRWLSNGPGGTDIEQHRFFLDFSISLDGEVSFALSQGVQTRAKPLTSGGVAAYNIADFIGDTLVTSSLDVIEFSELHLQEPGYGLIGADLRIDAYLFTTNTHSSVVPRSSVPSPVPIARIGAFRTWASHQDRVFMSPMFPTWYVTGEGPSSQSELDFPEYFSFPYLTGQEESPYELIGLSGANAHVFPVGVI
jgi:hypothetical protein